LIFGVAAASHGCSGGGGPGPLEVLETVPEDGATTVHLEVVLGVRFETELDDETLTTETFTLSEVDGAQVQGTVRLGGTADVAVFTPDEPLNIVTDYRATLTTDLLDVSGRALEADFTWRFRTLDDEWGFPEDVSQNTTGDARSAKIGADSSARAISVWLESDGVRDNVMASRFTRPELWGEPAPIEAADDVPSDLQLAVNVQGSAMAVWAGRNEGRDNIWANRYAAEEGWGIPTSVEAALDIAGIISTTPRVAIDSEGNALAVWYQTDILSAGFNVWSNRYTAGEGWGAAEIIETEPPSFRQPSIALGFDVAGNATAIWTREAEGKDDVWANRYTKGQGWGTAELIETSDNGGAKDLALAAATNGDVHALWSQLDDDGIQSLWTNVYSAGAWGNAALFDDEEVNAAESPDIVAAPMGVLHAAWAQSDGRLTNIWSKQYTPPGGWGAPQRIELPLEDPRDDGDAQLPQLSADDGGNVFAVWQQFDGAGFNIWSNRFTPEDGWFAAEMLEMDGGTAVVPQVAATPGRRAHAVWQQLRDGRRVVRTNRFE
jgi:hypothetical protein